jgi:hypothetical protein
MLTPTTPFSVASSPGVMLATPASSFVSLNCSPEVSPNVNPGTTKPTTVSWYNPAFPQTNIGATYLPGTSFPFPGVEQGIDTPKPSRHDKKRARVDEDEDDDEGEDDMGEDDGTPTGSMR